MEVMLPRRGEVSKPRRYQYPSQSYPKASVPLDDHTFGHIHHIRHQPVILFITLGNGITLTQTNHSWDIMPHQYILYTYTTVICTYLHSYTVHLDLYPLTHTFANCTTFGKWRLLTQPDAFFVLSNSQIRQDTTFSNVLGWEFFDQLHCNIRYKKHIVTTNTVYALQLILEEGIPIKNQVYHVTFKWSSNHKTLIETLWGTANTSQICRQLWFVFSNKL